MTDGNLHAPVFQHVIECVEQCRLVPGTAQVSTVGSGKVAEKSFGKQSRQPGDPGADVRVLRRCLKSDAAHARIHRQVEGSGFALLQGSLGKRRRVLVVVDGGADFRLHQRGVGGDGGVSQNQNGIVQSRPAQLHGLQNGGDAEKAALVLQNACHLNGAVAVGIGLDDGHHIGSHTGADGVDVAVDGIQIDFHIGVVEVQNISSKCVQLCIY